MSSAFPGTPQVVRGALVVYPTGRSSDQPRTLVFQYNPVEVRRTLADRSPPGRQGDAGAARADAMRVSGPPKETLALSVTMDAVDQYPDAPDGSPVREKGLLPALALLETLLYPVPDAARETQRMAARGEAQTQPLEKPAVLAVWGKHRSVPVKLTSFSVTEQMFDPRLNPIRAKVDLAMDVLADVDVEPGRVEEQAYRAYQQEKHNLAAMQQERQPVEGPVPG